MADQDPSSLTGFDESAGVASSDIKPDWMERVGPLLSPKHGGAMDKMLAQHHAQRLEQARIHKELLHNSTLALKKIANNFDPETGEAFATPEAKEAAAQKYTNRYNYAMEQFKKSAGISKEAKKGIEALDVKLKYIINNNNTTSPEAQPPQPQASPPPVTPQASPPPTAPRGPTPPPKAEGGGQATAAPSAASTAVTAPSVESSNVATGTPPVITNGKATTGGGGVIGNAAGPDMRKTQAARKPTPMPDFEANDPEGRLDAGELRRSLAIDQNIQAQRRLGKATIDMRKDQAKQIGLKEGSTAWQDYMANGRVLATATKVPTTPMGAWWQAQVDSGHEPTPQEVTDQATKLKGTAGDPRKQIAAEAAQLQASGDTEGAKKKLAFLKNVSDAMKGGSATGGTSLLATIKQSRDPNATPEERALAAQAIKDYTSVNYNIRAAYAIEGAKRRFGSYLVSSGRDKGRVITASAEEVRQRQAAGEQITGIGQPNYAAVTGLQKFTKEAPSALKELRGHLDAFDDEQNRAVFARVLGEVGSQRTDEDELSYAGRLLDQALKGRDPETGKPYALTAEGRNLIIALNRVKDTVFTVQSALGAQKTDAATAIFMSMLPGATTPDADYARQQVDQFENNAKNSLVPAMYGLVDIPGEWKQPGMEDQTPTTAPRSSKASKSPRQTAPPETGGGTVKFMDGTTPYNIPVGMEKDFLKDHPNAKRQ